MVIWIYLNEYNDLFIILSHTSPKHWEISEFSCKELMKKAEGEQGNNVETCHGASGSRGAM